MFNFDWGKFTKADYERYIEKCKNDEYDSHDYLGAVYVGDICIDLIDYRNAGTRIDKVDLLVYDFYVAHEDTGYGYKNDILPYDYADGDGMEVPYALSYEDFKRKAERLFADYIEKHDKTYGYSLIEHANRPLEMW